MKNYFLPQCYKADHEMLSSELKFVQVSNQYGNICHNDNSSI